ncbi:hypothetical protein Tco_0647310, partial [Tanacetum coccineum]
TSGEVPAPSSESVESPVGLSGTSGLRPAPSLEPPD